MSVDKGMGWGVGVVKDKVTCKERTAEAKSNRGFFA